MKCGAYKIFKTTKSGKNKFFQFFDPYHIKFWKVPTINKIGEPNYNKKLPEFDLNKLIPCDGNIVATIKADYAQDYSYDESNSGYAELLISYKCDKCGHNFYQELPQNAESLSEFLTNSIKMMSDEQRQVIIKEKSENYFK